MHVQVGDIKLFFDVESAKLVADGPVMREQPTLLLLHGGPGFDHSSDVMFASGGGEDLTFNLLPALAGIRCPTLVLGGEDDPITPIGDAEDIAAALPAHLVRFERFANCGHGVFRDEAERAFRIIREFLLSGREWGEPPQGGLAPFVAANSFAGLASGDDGPLTRKETE